MNLYITGDKNSDDGSQIKCPARCWCCNYKNYEIIEPKVYPITKLGLDYRLTWPIEQEDESKPDSVEENK